MSPDDESMPPGDPDAGVPEPESAPAAPGDLAGAGPETPPAGGTSPPRQLPVESVGPAAELVVPASAIPGGVARAAAEPSVIESPAASPPPQPAAHAPTPPDDAGPAAELPTPLHERLWIPLNAHLVVLTASITLIFVAFVLIEPTPRWLLIFGAIVAVMGVDGTMRATWRVPFSDPAPIDTTPYLFLPALFVLAAPILIEHNSRGYAVIPAALIAGVAFGAVVLGEVLSVHERSGEYAIARWLVAAGAYFVAFTLFAMPYVFELSLQTSIGAVALVSVMLALELLREGQVDPLETIVYAFVTGLVMGELRWSLHYLPIDGYLAGLALVLAFFLVTGVVSSYLTRRLDAVLAIEYGIVAALGLALVVFARASGAA